MKAIAISGSPRTNGNTELLLKKCLGKLEENQIKTQFVSLGNQHVKPCTACSVCTKTKDKTCAQKDDCFQDIFQRMLESDIIIVGSPVYFGSATPQIMSLLDRAGYVSRANGNLFSRKIGGPIVVARRAGQNFTFAQLLYWYLINDMTVTGSTYWNIAFGREPGTAANDEEGVNTVLRFAENLAWLGKKVFEK